MLFRTSHGSPHAFPTALPSMIGPPTRSWLPPAWICVVAIAVLAGAYLRLDQFISQVLIDDEWHAVHQVLQRTPGAMFLDFGYADYSIPLGILDWYEAHWWGLSEFALRWPMVLCGLATLAVLPLYVAPRLGRTTAAVFALLVAISPLLVVYSRMARPYAITLLLGWIAHGAFQRYHASRGGETPAGLAYGAAAALATWLHPIVALFVLAPLLWALAQLRHAAPGERGARLLRLAKLAIPTISVIAALVLPPLLANPQSISGKSGVGIPDVETFIGAWHTWLGTPSTTVVVLCVALAAYGAPGVWRTLPEARTGLLGAALTLLAVMLTRPMWSQNSLTLARYLLPFVPLLLLAVAAGAIRFASHVAPLPTTGRRALAAGVAAVPIVALAVQSPLAPMLRHPNGQTLHMMYHFDFRLEKNPFLQRFGLMPLSPFWQSLAARPEGSVRIAAAPFYFESYNWDAPRWERLSRQTVLPGYLTGLCVEKRWGEVPQMPTFKFRNAMHLADDAALARQQIDYVVWQKPFVLTGDETRATIGEGTAHCEAALRTKFGPPAFEDSIVIAFRVPRADPPAPNAER
jgi:Dolichyl-phosphate-mannose-protein mannosyltransferase